MLIHSPAWTSLPFDLVKALKSRSDLVVSNEPVILNGLEKWAAAQENTAIPEVLWKLIRFPMMPAEDLYTLNGSLYHASKLQGFQFNALPYVTLLNDLAEGQNICRPIGFTLAARGALPSITIPLKLPSTQGFPVLVAESTIM